MVTSTDTADAAPDPEGSDADASTAEAQAGFGLQSRDVVPVLAMLAGAGAVISSEQPTGNLAADVLWSFGFAAAITWLAACATRAAVLLSALLALFFTALELPAAIMAGAALAGALFIAASNRYDRDSREIGSAFSAAMTSQAVLNLPNIGFDGSASLLAAIAVLPVLVVGFRRLDEPARRLATRALAAVAFLAIAATGLAVIAALSARSDVETGISQAEAGVDAVQFGDQPAALALLDNAEGSFTLASDRLGGPLTWPARWVPIAAQHARALETAADQGRALVTTAARTVNQADVDKIRGRNGAIDLATVEAVNAELTLANRTLRAAQVSLADVTTPWLVPQLSSRLDSVRVELDDTAADIDLANHATSVIPGIMGADGSRTYVVLFVQPAESREFGGFVGAYGLLFVDQGRFTLLESGAINTDFGLGEARFDEAGRFPEAFVSAAPMVNPQNLTATADLSTIAEALRELAPQWREDPDFAIDGVMTIDPYALAGILELTGPVFVADRPEPIDSSNVIDYLLRDQYIEFDAFDRAERKEVLNELAAQAFERLFSIEIPGPEQLGAIFGPAARANRLAMTTFDDRENAFLDRIFLSADLPQVGSAVDMLGVYSQTGVAAKLDAFASRSISYDVLVNPSTGAVTADLEIVDSNNAPLGASSYVLGDDPLPDPDGNTMAQGDNFIALGLYTRAEVASFTATTPYRQTEPSVAFSYERHPIFYTVPQGGQATVTATLTSTVEPGRYDLFIPAQALANPSQVTVSVRPTAGWEITGRELAADGSWSSTFSLDEAQGLTFLFEPRE